ncbi:glycosyltransferase family 2 protein [Thalassomonas sp. M1454]|uniref:glycosyltransferase family 2 protein n=1 Tax=Thalassomonas sp. M1454 TaxID=2594477 RepID=UPI00117C836E|nr:glycosyltransferase [Thalassomonas sp. M1454]TRX58161.1 glycosyltransferase [Thalassomonas sp. M1454]
MSKTKIYTPRFYDGLLAFFFKLAASGYIPASWFLKNLPEEQARSKKIGNLNIEVVSHCWGYSHMMAYQLSSLVNYPPKKAHVTMTVFYSPEDEKTQKQLDFFSSINVENVTWNWQPLPKELLFRRAIGRNRAALETKADWVWFSDCDIMFNENCIDSLVDSLQGRNDILVFPKKEKTTPMLKEDHPLLQKDAEPQVIRIENEENFEYYSRSKATGEFQITHGDVARAAGYCANISIYQTPSNHWCKCVEDRCFRWLLGTHGVAIDIDNIFQIRHVTKGRYKKGSLWSRVRSKIRHLKLKS